MQFEIKGNDYTDLNDYTEYFQLMEVGHHGVAGENAQMGPFRAIVCVMHQFLEVQENPVMDPVNSKKKDVVSHNVGGYGRLGTHIGLNTVLSSCLFIFHFRFY